MSLLRANKVVFPLKGSSGSDFSDDLKPDYNPLPPCPGSPNCVRISADIQSEPSILFNILSSVLREMKAEEIEPDLQSLRMKAVFRIPVFGFRDDMFFKIESGKDKDLSILHLSSRSRIGRGDFGVNRRRVKTFLRILDNHLN